MSQEKDTGRIEAFSDGVFAIAITLLVLDIKVPQASDISAAGGLTRALLAQWPTYLSYVTSFLTILIMWTNHHQLFKQIARTDHWFLLFNGLLLMVISVIPFPTSLVAEHILGPDAATAAALYSAGMVLVALAFNLVWRYAAHNFRLLRSDMDSTFVRHTSRQYLFGPVLYLVAFILAFVMPVVSIAFCLALAIFFAIPTPTSDESS